MVVKRKRIIKIFSLIVLVLAVIIIGLVIFIFYRAENYINKNLSQIVAEESNNLYTLDFYKINIEIKSFSVSITDVCLDVNENESEKALDRNPNKVFYSFKSPEIIFQNIDIFALFLHKRFLCKSISFVQPDLKLTGRDLLQNESEKKLKQVFIELQPLFKKYVKNVQVKQINFIDANYKLYEGFGDSLHVSNANQISVKIKNFTTDSTMIYDNDLFFESDDISIQMNQFYHQLGDSLHFLHIDSLEYSLNTFDIFAQGVSINHSAKNTKKNLYEVRVPNMYMRSKNITRFEFSDSLMIQYLNFDSPKINFFQKENSDQISIEKLNSFNLFTLIENQFQSINIDTLVLSDAELKIHKQPEYERYQQDFKKLNIELYNFELDSSSSKNPLKLLHADQLEMDVSDYHLRLEDNMHEFRADSMYFSTISNSLGIRYFSIIPDSLATQQSRTEVHIDCNALNIKDVNLKTLFHTRKLPTTKIEIENPNVNIDYHTNIEKSVEQKEAGLLFEMVSAYLKGVYSDIVHVKSGILKIQNINNSHVEGYFETNFNFNLAGFSLDSTSIKRTDKFFYANSFDIQFTDYQMRLVDNLHKLNADKISFFSFERKVEIENLHLQPVIKGASDSTMQKYQRSELYNIFVPRITLWGIDLRTAFFYNRLNISTFQISNPRINFENFGALRQTQNRKESSEIYELVFNYISDFNIKKINIPNGNFSWVNHTKKGKTTSFDNDFSATLENFILNNKELEKQRLLFSDNFDISIKDQIFQLSDSVHILRAGEINLSTKKSIIDIKDGLLYPVITSQRFNKLNTTFQVTIPEMQIRNIDFQKAYYSHELDLSEINLNNAKFEVYTKKGVAKTMDFNKYKIPLPAFIRSFSVTKLNVRNGNIMTYLTDGIKHKSQSNFNIDLTIPNISFSNKNGIQSQLGSSDFMTTIYNFNFPLGKSHLLKIERVDFSRSKKDISIQNLKVNSILKKKTTNNYSVSAPFLHFRNFDYNEALDNNSFIFDEILFTKPDISIEINDSIEGDKFEIAKNLDLFPFVNPYLNRIEIGKLYLNEANLSFNWFSKQLFDKKINIKFDEIKIGENQTPGNLLNSKEFEISFTNLKQKSSNNLYEFIADSLIYNSKQHSIQLRNIQVNPLLKKELFPKQTGFQTDFVKSSISFIELKHVNENSWLKKNILEAKQVKIGNTKLEIFRDKRYPFNHNQRPPWPQDLLKEIKQKFIFDSLLLAPSQIIYSELSEIADTPAKINFNRLTLKTGKISNSKKVIQQNKTLQIFADCELFNSTKLNAEFNFDLNTNSHNHTITGSLGNMSFAEINSVLVKSEPLRIESGDLNRFDFILSFTDKIATGELYFGYDNFEISLLDRSNDKIRKSKLASFWANKMILNSKNPKGDTFLPTSITYERDIERSIISYWWKAILSGTKETLGIKSGNTEKKE